MSVMLVSFIISACLIFSCSSQCAYFDLGGIGVPLGYCHTSSGNGSFTSYSWSCDGTGEDLLIDVWYQQKDCSGESTYSGDYNDFEDIDKSDYSCVGTGAECTGVVLKMYGDRKCESNAWTKMRLVTDKCFGSENGTSTLVECDATTADAFIYDGTECSEDMLVSQTSFLESGDRCTKIIACDDEHALSTLKPESTESTTTTEITTTTDPNSCSYVNLGGTPVPLGYCHQVSTSLSETSYEFSCKHGEIMWTHYSDSHCHKEFYRIEANKYYNVENSNCGGSVDNCETVELKIYTNPLSKSCSGDMWQTAQYVTNQCLDAADGGSMKYMCTTEVAHVFRYSDENCNRLLNFTDVDDNCYQVFKCGASSGSSTMFPRPHNNDQFEHQQTSVARTLLTLAVVLTIVAILFVVICFYRRKQQRLQREVANMTGEQSARSRAKEVGYANVNINDEQLIGEGLGNPGSDVVVTAYA